VLPALLRCPFRRGGLAALEDSGTSASFFCDCSFWASFLDTFLGAGFLVLLGGFAG
jgi:hypothetical protein